MTQYTKILILALAAGLVFSGFSQAQQVAVAPGNGIKIKEVQKEAQKTPSFQAGDVKGKKVDSPRDWLEIEVEFEADRVKPADAILPELLFRYYIGMTTDKGQSVVLTGDVTHINVIGGEKYFSAVYVAPSTLGKITGDFKRLDMGKVKATGVEIYFNGVLVGKHTSTGSDFWTTVQGQPGVLSREKTPFSLLWIDRYPEVKIN